MKSEIKNKNKGSGRTAQPAALPCGFLGAVACKQNTPYTAWWAVKEHQKKGNFEGKKYRQKRHNP